jgi:hypothetical protein
MFNVPVHHGVEGGKDLLVGQIARRAEEYEGIRFRRAHERSNLRSRRNFELLQQFQHQRDAGRLIAEVALQAQRDARAPQRAPLKRHSAAST